MMDHIADQFKSIISNQVRGKNASQLVIFQTFISPSVIELFMEKALQAINFDVRAGLYASQFIVAGEYMIKESVEAGKVVIEDMQFKECILEALTATSGKNYTEDMLDLDALLEASAGVALKGRNTQYRFKQ